MLEIRETTYADLENIRSLWANGDVMKYVGFPEGLHETYERMKEWFSDIKSSRPITNHFSIFDDNIYCGETYYSIDTDHDFIASVDIKLFPFARSKNIAYNSLKYAILTAFGNGAKTVWVDPNPKNEKALSLYNRLGFKKANPPQHIAKMEEGWDCMYMELSRESFFALFKEF